MVPAQPDLRWSFWDTLGVLMLVALLLYALIWHFNLDF
jgi:hypothetical protein